MTQEAKVVLITGATAGIGKEIAKGLGEKGYEIVFTTRNDDRGKKALKWLKDESGNKSFTVMHCDLASFESIRSFADKFLKKYDKLDILINNAGVWPRKRKESVDGLESTFAVNHLGPFLLTNLLLDAVKKAKGRIINVSSKAHFKGRVNFSDLEQQENWSGTRAYCNSKLMNILFTKELAMRLHDKNVTVNAVHPGLIASKLGRHLNIIARGIYRLIGKSPEKGAETPIYLAYSPEVKGITGEYFENKKIAQSSRESHDMEKAARLWKVSEEYTGLA